MHFPLRKRRKSSCRRERTRRLGKLLSLPSRRFLMWKCTVTVFARWIAASTPKPFATTTSTISLPRTRTRLPSLRIGATSSTTLTARFLSSFPLSIRERTSMSSRSPFKSLSGMIPSMTSARSIPVCYRNSLPKATTACSSASTSPLVLRQTRCVPRSPSLSALKATSWTISRHSA